MEATVDEGAPDAPPVVLLHGQPGSAGDWYRVTPLLDDDHRVIAVDRPGYGEDRRTATGWAGNTDALLALLDGLDLREPAVLVGTSWGGGVALEAALREPGRVRGLVLAASVGSRQALSPIDRVMAWPGVYRAGGAFMRRAGHRAGRALAVSAGSTLDADAAVAVRIALALWADTGAWAAAGVEQRTLVAEAPGLDARLERVAVPAVVLAGTRDRYVPFAASEDLARRLPDARFVRLERAGHLLPLERPTEIAAAVRSLTGLPAGRRKDGGRSGA